MEITCIRHVPGGTGGVARSYFPTPLDSRLSQPGQTPAYAMLSGRSWASRQLYRNEINEIPRVLGVLESALEIRWVGAGKVPTDGSGQVGVELANGKRVIANRSIVVAGTFVPTIKYWTHRLIKYLHGSQ